MTAGRAEAGAVGVIGVVAVAVLGYRLGAGDPAAGALGAGLAVLLVAVPGGLRLATGLPLLVGVARAAQLGVLLAGPEELAAARRVDTVVIAGTGALTTGEPEVQHVHTRQGVAPADVLRLAGAVAQESDRPVDRAVAAAASRLPGVAEFDAVPELGVRGIVAELVAGPGEEPTVLAHAVLVGGVDWLAAHDVDLPADLAVAVTTITAAGRTPVAVAWDGVARGVLDVGRGVPPTTAAALLRLRGCGLRPVLLTRQDAPAALAVAGRAGLELADVVATTTPAGAAAHVRRLREDGACVAVVADGAAYGAALDAADLALHTAPAPGIAGTRGLVLVRGDLPTAVDAIRLARRTGVVMRANAVWALGCTAVVLPATATGLLGPLLATAATGVVGAVLVANSLRLQRHGTTDG